MIVNLIRIWCYYVGLSSLELIGRTKSTVLYWAWPTSGKTRCIFIIQSYYCVFFPFFFIETPDDGRTSERIAWREIKFAPQSSENNPVVNECWCRYASPSSCLSSNTTFSNHLFFCMDFPLESPGETLPSHWHTWFFHRSRQLKEIHHSLSCRE